MQFNELDQRTLPSGDGRRRFSFLEGRSLSVEELPVHSSEDGAVSITWEGISVLPTNVIVRAFEICRASHVTKNLKYPCVKIE